MLRTNIQTAIMRTYYLHSTKQILKYVFKVKLYLNSKKTIAIYVIVMWFVITIVKSWEEVNSYLFILLFIFLLYFYIYIFFKFPLIDNIQHLIIFLIPHHNLYSSSNFIIWITMVRYMRFLSYIVTRILFKVLYNLFIRALCKL